MNFDLIIHSMLNTMLTSVVPLDVATHILMVFLMEGQKVLFRMMIGCLKLNKPFIKSLPDKKNFLAQVKQNSAGVVELGALLKLAFTAKISTTSSVPFGTKIKYN